jgi:hypothetical protein
MLNIHWNALFLLALECRLDDNREAFLSTRPPSNDDGLVDFLIRLEFRSYLL